MSSERIWEAYPEVPRVDEPHPENLGAERVDITSEIALPLRAEQEADILVDPECPAEQPAGPALPFITAEDVGGLYETYATPLRIYLTRKVSDREQAADLTQQVFEKALRALQGDSKGRINNAEAWLYRIATNTAYDALRRRRIIDWQPFHMLFPDERPSQNDYGDVSRKRSFEPTTEFENDVAEGESFKTALKSLPAHYASALILRHVHNWGYEDIAEELKTAPSGIKMLLSRARAQLKAAYKDNNQPKA